jgi:hypothetical protein
LDEIVLPETGRVRAGVLLEGEHYARFCPQYLVEILDSTPVIDEQRPLLVEPKELVEPVKESEGDGGKTRVLVEEASPAGEVSFDDLRKARKSRRRSGTRSSDLGIG